MARGNKRLGLTPAEIEAGLEDLHAAYHFLTQVCIKYPIKFDSAEPFGAAQVAHRAIAGVGTALTGDSKLFYSQKLRPPEKRPKPTRPAV